MLCTAIQYSSTITESISIPFKVQTILNPDTLVCVIFTKMEVLQSRKGVTKGIYKGYLYVRLTRNIKITNKIKWQCAHVGGLRKCNSILVTDLAHENPVEIVAHNHRPKRELIDYWRERCTENTLSGAEPVQELHTVVSHLGRENFVKVYTVLVDFTSLHHL